MRVDKPVTAIRKKRQKSKDDTKHRKIINLDMDLAKNRKDIKKEIMKRI